MKNIYLKSFVMIVFLTLGMVACGGGSLPAVIDGTNQSGEGVVLTPGGDHGGNVVGIVETDPEGVTDSAEVIDGVGATDSTGVTDGAGVTDSNEVTDGGGEENADEVGESIPPDMDGDGISDSEDEDIDGDGVSVANGDCNDLNLNIFPGAEDKPDYPNYSDNNCDGVDGDVANAYWVAPEGNDNNPGTIDQPFLTIQKGVDMAEADPANIKDVYVAGGSYAEAITLDNGAGFFGGFGPLTETLTRKRNTSLYETTIASPNGLTTLSIVASQSGEESTVEGLTVIGNEAAIPLAIVNASPKIKYNNIFALNSTNFSFAVYILAMGQDVSMRPQLNNNTIWSGDALTNEHGSSVAVMSCAFGPRDSLDLTLDNNTIQSNNASQASVGVYMFSDVSSAAHMNATNNTIRAGEATSMTGGIVLGYEIFGGNPMAFSSATIRNNRISGGRNAAENYGVYILNTTGLVDIDRNVIMGGDLSTEQNIGVFVAGSEAKIRKNTIDAGNSIGDVIGILLDADAHTEIEYNTLFAGNAITRIGILENAATSTPSVLKGNFFDVIFNVLYHDRADGDISDIDYVNDMLDIDSVGGNTVGSTGLGD